MERWILSFLLCFLACRPPSPPGEEIVVQLTETGARNGQAAFSPDGERIAFVSNREDGWQVWVMPASGGEAERLTSVAEPAGGPAWLPGPEALLFYARQGGRYRILRLHLESGTTEPFFDEAFDTFRPRPSPDGRRLLFDGVDPAQGNHEIYVRDLDSGNVAQLTRSPAYDSDARWSPDGEQVVFHSDRGAGELHTQVYLMAADGGEVRALTQGPAVNAYPNWSPNGKCIVYTSELDGNRDLWLMGVSGEGKRRLTFHGGFDGDPVWHPRGGRILFSTDRFGGQELAWLRLERRNRRSCEE